MDGGEFANQAGQDAGIFLQLTVSYRERYGEPDDVPVLLRCQEHHALL